MCTDAGRSSLCCRSCISKDKGLFTSVVTSSPVFSWAPLQLFFLPEIPSLLDFPTLPVPSRFFLGVTSSRKPSLIQPASGALPVRSAHRSCLLTLAWISTHSLRWFTSTDPHLAGSSTTCKAGSCVFASLAPSGSPAHSWGFIKGYHRQVRSLTGRMEERHLQVHLSYICTDLPWKIAQKQTLIPPFADSFLAPISLNNVLKFLLDFSTLSIIFWPQQCAFKI